MAYLYRHIRLDKNEPFYIGIGSDENGKYLRAKKKDSRSKYWHSIVKNHGYSIDIILDDLTWEDAQKKEIEFISLYGRKINKSGILCNITEGGGGTVGCKPNITKESREKLRLSSTGRIYSTETRLKISESLKGKKQTKESIENSKNAKRLSFELNGRKPHSEETKKKIAIANSKKILSEETKIKISQFNKGKILSEETKIKMSKAKKGKKKNPDSVQKTLKTKRERIKTYGFWNGYIYAYKSEDMSFVGKFETFRDVTKSIGVHSASIYKVLRGQLKSTCGYFFKKEK